MNATHVDRYNRVEPQFVEHIVRTIDYWRERTQEMDEHAIREADRNRQNLHRAVEYGLKLAKTWPATAGVVLQAFPLAERRGYWLEWIAVIEKALAHCPRPEQERWPRFKLLNRLGQLHRLSNKLPQAIASHEAARAIAEELDDEAARAEVDYNLGEVYARSRDYEKAESHALDALTRFERLPGTERWLASVLNTLGVTAQQRGDLHAAGQNLYRAVAVARELDDPLYLSRFLNNLATALQAAGKFDEAAACLHEAAGHLAPTTYELDKIGIQINLGYLYYQQERWAEAEQAFQQADSEYLRHSGDTNTQATLANNLGNVALKRGKMTAAAAHLNKAITLWRQLDEQLYLANSLGTLAEVWATQSDTAPNRERIQEAIHIFDEAIPLLECYPENPWACKLLAKFRTQREALGKLWERYGDGVFEAAA